ncbi:DUF4350 domain-containing protein [Kitasatospora sp. NPDC051914]|uniref:DUF4350 domain-containing protein n=1 Tax=Kitasatospora sp. NPDC051914 TaxID=3154945 RepID=UPI0034290B19
MTTAPPTAAPPAAEAQDGTPDGTAADPGAPAGTAPGTSLAVPVRRRWRRARWYLLAAAFLLLVGLLVGGLGGSSAWPPLDPRSPDPEGARAAVRLLEREGVTVRTAAGEAELTAALGAADTTVVLPDPYLLDPALLDRLAADRGPRSRLVLLAPDDAQLDAFARGVRTSTAADGLPDYASELSTPPQCSLPEATAAGSAELGGLLYDPAPGDTGCYPRHNRPTLVLHTDGSGRQTAVLGTDRPLTNQRLAKDGNASLALGLLGSRPHLVWYLPDYDSTGTPATAGRRSLLDHVPAGWNWAALQLALAAALAAAWRARRLGPVVSEELPVVVRAAETTEGRARLYRRANARGHAADALRRAARHRIAPVLGVPVSAGEPDPAALCAAAAGRIGRPSADLHALLYGEPPTDDAALLRLSDDLDALERQVRQP